MKQTTYRQAVLSKGSRTKVAWIPSALAVVGHHLRLHDDDGWKVTRIFRKMAGQFVRDREHDHRYQRRVSDV